MTSWDQEGLLVLAQLAALILFDKIYKKKSLKQKASFFYNMQCLSNKAQIVK